MRWAAVAVALLLAGCGAGARAPAPLRVAAERGGLGDEVATGFPVGGDRVVTVAHVLAGALRVDVGGRRARVLRADRRLDLAVLAVPGLDAPRVRIAARGADGELRVLRDGRARRVAARVQRRATAVLRTPAATYRRPALELRATVMAGDSGAPVVDSDGRLLGVLFARASSGARTAWAVDAAALATVLGRSGPV